MLNATDSSAHAPVDRRLGTLLIVEDDALIALALETVARDLGTAAVEIAATPEAAAQAASTGAFDGAILEIRTASGPTQAVADILADRNVPFLFCTAFGREDLAERHRNRPLLAKPFTELDLSAWLTRLARE
jgi:CheY-like chemotaxis protein